MKFCNHLFIFHQKQKQIWFQVIKQYCFQFVFTQFEAADNSPCRGDRWVSNYWNEWVRYCFSSCLFLVGCRDLFCVFTSPVPLVRSWGSPQIRRFCGLFFSGSGSHVTSSSLHRKDAKTTLASHETNSKEADSTEWFSLMRKTDSQ